MSDDFVAKGFGNRFMAPGVGSDAETRQDEQPLDLVEISGRIKWFDVSKGFGFIVPDNGMPDVLIHVSCLRRDGYQSAPEGAKITCEVLERHRELVLVPSVMVNYRTTEGPSAKPR